MYLRNEFPRKVPYDKGLRAGNIPELGLGMNPGPQPRSPQPAQRPRATAPQALRKYSEPPTHSAKADPLRTRTPRPEPLTLVIEQSPYPGEENSHSRAADPPPATRAAWPPPAQADWEARDAPEPPPLLSLLPRWPPARFLGTGGRPKPRPPCRARGPAAAAAALAWLADIAAALSATSLAGHRPPPAPLGRQRRPRPRGRRRRGAGREGAGAGARPEGRGLGKGARRPWQSRAPCRRRN